MKLELILGLFVLSLFFIFFYSLKMRKIPIDPNTNKHLIGGCKGTRYGCCPESKVPCNKNCSNC